jgi:hypothetical protein
LSGQIFDKPDLKVKQFVANDFTMSYVDVEKALKAMQVVFDLRVYLNIFGVSYLP